MQKKGVSFIKNFSYSFLANLIMIIVSGFSSLILPRVMGIEEYGYWQLFLFYSSYLAFAQIGWSDGIYLRYGGKSFGELNKGLFKNQFLLYIFFQFTIGLLFFVYSKLVISSAASFVYEMLAISLFLENTLNLFRLILQSTNRFKLYSYSILIDRLTYLFLAIVILVISKGSISSEIIIMASLLGNTLSLIITSYFFKDFFLEKAVPLRKGLSETKDNIEAGIYLLFSNISNMLIIGIVRFGIEMKWSIIVFAQVSLILNFSNLISKFVNTIGLVLFPFLRTIQVNTYKSIYRIIRDSFTISVLTLFLLFYPLREALEWWLPEYTLSISYMSVLFPISLYQGKMALLINPFMKTLRNERQLLFLNFITFGVSIILTLLSVLLFENLTLAITSILITLAFRSYLAELLLSKRLELNNLKQNLSELIIVIVFVLLGFLKNSLVALMLYVIMLLLYIIFNKENIFSSFKFMKNRIKSSK